MASESDDGDLDVAIDRHDNVANAFHPSPPARVREPVRPSRRSHVHRIGRGRSRGCRLGHRSAVSRDTGQRERVKSAADGSDVGGRLVDVASYRVQRFLPVVLAR